MAWIDAVAAYRKRGWQGSVLRVAIYIRNGATGTCFLLTRLLVAALIQVTLLLVRHIVRMVAMAIQIGSSGSFPPVSEDQRRAQLRKESIQQYEAYRQQLPDLPLLSPPPDVRRRDTRGARRSHARAA